MIYYLLTDENGKGTIRGPTQADFCRKPLTVHRKPSFFTLKTTHMNYSVSMLTTRPDCQVLINIASSEKENLAYRKTGLQLQLQTVSVTSVGITTDLVAVTAEVTNLQSVLAGLTPGPTYNDTLVRLTKAEYRKFLLEQRKGNFGPIGLVEKEYDLACIERSITETDELINSLTTRMAELPA